MKAAYSPGSSVPCRNLTLVGYRGQKLGLRVVRVEQLLPVFTHALLSLQAPTPGPDRAEEAPLIA